MLLTQFCQTAINKTAPVLPTPERQINAFDDTKSPQQAHCIIKGTICQKIGVIFVPIFSYAQKG